MITNNIILFIIFSGVGRVFTWGYGNDGQLSNNENKGRYAFGILVHVDKHMQSILYDLCMYHTPTELHSQNKLTMNTP